MTGQASELGLLELRDGEGRLRAMSMAGTATGSTYREGLLCWKLSERVWAGRPVLAELFYEPEDPDAPPRVDETLTLPAREGCILLERPLRRYSIVPTKPLPPEKAPTPELTELPPQPAMIEERDETGRLRALRYPEGVFGYGSEGTLVFWKLTEAAWEQEPDQLLRLWYGTPEEMREKMTAGEADEELTVTEREGCLELEREPIFLMLCSREFAAFHHLTMETARQRREEAARTERGLVLSCKGGQLRLRAAELLYAEVRGHSLTLRTLSGEYTLRRSLQWLEEQLPFGLFARPHESFLVNLSQVEALGPDSLRLAGDIVLPLSRSRAAAFREKLDGR